MSAKAIESKDSDRKIKRFLRDLTSHQYFKEGGWTANPDEAHEFTDVAEATSVCVQYGLKNVELALRFAPAGCDVYSMQLR